MESSPEFGGRLSWCVKRLLFIMSLTRSLGADDRLKLLSCWLTMLDRVHQPPEPPLQADPAEQLLLLRETGDHDPPQPPS